jgi:hypothetical protein
VGRVACLGDRRGAYRILVWRPEGTRIVIMGLNEVGWGGKDWIDLAQDRDRWREFLFAGMNFRVP